MNIKRIKSIFKNKIQKVKNLILQDCNGDELEFPDLEENDMFSVGDKILIDNKPNETGERLMPNGILIKFEKGIVTEIIEPKEPKDLIKTIKDKLNRKVQIMGPDKSKPFLKGNRILVDGRELIIGKIQINNMKITVHRGEISKVEKV